MANCCSFDIKISGPKPERERLFYRYNYAWIIPGTPYEVLKGYWYFYSPLQQALRPQRLELGKSWTGLLPAPEEPFTIPYDDDSLYNVIGMDKFLFDVEVRSTQRMVHIGGWSKWCEPSKTIITISREFPELVFDMKYYEPGCNLRGDIVIQNGEWLDE